MNVSSPPRSCGRRERRLLAHLRHDDGPARIDHAARDRVHRAIARARRPEPDTARCFHVQLAARLVEENHGAAGDLMAPLQQLDEGVETVFRLSAPDSAWLTSSRVASRRISFV